MPLTMRMRRNRTMKSKLSIERVHSRARLVACRSTLREALPALTDTPGDVTRRVPVWARPENLALS